jgi:hypothetical protein
VITPDHSEPCGSGFIRANAEVSRVVGETLYQVRMGYAGIQLALGDSFEYQIIVDTPLAVTTTGAAWAGEPLTKPGSSTDPEIWRSCARRAANTSPCSNLTRTSDVVACC